MSERFPGGVISATPVVPTSSSAPGVWTLDQQQQAQKAGMWPSSVVNYIEDVFSTYLYAGNDTSQSITNNIDLSTKGGLVWIKGRAGYNGAQNHAIFDTARGANKWLSSNTSVAENTGTTNFLNAFNTTGFSITSTGNGRDIVNDASTTFVSWTFRKQAKFFDVVTFTTNSSGNAVFSHALGSTPGCVVFKSIYTSENWWVYHQGLNGGTNPGNYYNSLNTTAAQNNFGSTWIVPTSTNVTVQNSGLTANTTYVAYIFAHNAGGFGLTGTDNVISCGSFTTGASGITTVDLGYEPQYLLFKTSSTTGDWIDLDNMRGFSMTQNNILSPNTIGAEDAWGNGYVKPTATGFTADSSWIGTSRTFIYIAIRRGPMKVPTDATKVFAPTLGSSGAPGFKTSFPVDMGIGLYRPGGNAAWQQITSRLQGAVYMATASTAAETSTPYWTWDYQNGFNSYLTWDTNTEFALFQRAPGFFDEVCYTGDGTSSRVINHNLGVAPELIIKKTRSATGGWNTQATGTLGYSSNLTLNNTNANTTNGTTYLFASGTSTTITTAVDPTYINSSGVTYVVYLFATCPGVSKVGSYTGNGTTQTIDCGFTGGARFVLIKRTDSTGDWYVWDTARGMVIGTDPSLLLNSTAAEVNANSVYTTTGGFQIVSTAAGINASGGTYIFLAIA